MSDSIEDKLWALKESLGPHNWAMDFSYSDHKRKYYDYLRSPEWKEKREKKLESVGHRCEICGVGSDTHQLVIHHKSYYSVFRERLCDLEVLCEDGHDYRHSRRINPCVSFKPKVILRKRK
jgi:hypothetical protein